LAPYLRKKSPVKRGLLWIIAVYMLGCGCLIAPDIEEDPGEINYPPEIVLDKLVPPDAIWNEIDFDDSVVECSPVYFRVNEVRDRNIKDTLYIAWFLDWDPTLSGEWSGQNILPNGEESRPGKFNRLEKNQVDIDSYHRLRVFVADRPPRRTTEGIGIEFEEGVDGQFDFYEWSFKASEGIGYCVTE
jgi:hypothetical protein